MAVFFQIFQKPLKHDFLNRPTQNGSSLGSRDIARIILNKIQRNISQTFISSLNVVQNKSCNIQNIANLPPWGWPFLAGSFPSPTCQRRSQCSFMALLVTKMRWHRGSQRFSRTEVENSSNKARPKTSLDFDLNLTSITLEPWLCFHAFHLSLHMPNDWGYGRPGWQMAWAQPVFGIMGDFGSPTWLPWSHQINVLHQQGFLARTGSS